jgi:hypothetical protein
VLSLQPVRDSFGVFDHVEQITATGASRFFICISFADLFRELIFAFKTVSRLTA